MADNAPQAAASPRSNDGIDELSNNPGTAPHQPSPSQPRRPRKCRFFGTKAGCRSGSNCPFLHETSETQVAQTHDTSAATSQGDVAAAGRPQGASDAQGSEDVVSQSQRREPATAQRADRRVQKPISQAQVDDPRMFQLNQIRRRYRPAETQNSDATVLELKIAPSDPDFPFELESLQCTLTVPISFPAEMSQIRVTNKEMGRGYQLNVEAGFYRIVKDRPQGTILQWLNALDKQLEELLTKEKADTVKIVANTGKKPEPAVAPSTLDKGKASRPEVSKPPAKPIQPPRPVYSAAQLQAAKSKRDVDTRQLEARLGRLPQYVKSSDGLAYTVPLDPRKRDALPSSIQSVKTVKLIVPELYNLQPCRIELQGVSGRDAENLHEAFRLRCIEHPDLSLISHINYLSQNMHTMAATDFIKKDEPVPETVPEAPPKEEAKEVQPEVILPTDDDSRSHIIKIPRPPEWDAREGGSSSDSDNSYTSSAEEDEDEDAESETEEAQQSQAETSDVQRGILLSFPHLEMHGIELMEVYSISLEIKCDRCKTQMDIQNLKNNAKVDTAGVRSESCRKCANPISIGYRMDLIHANSVKAGYVDLDGATVVDLLPSNFIPTCSQCSTASPQPGVSSVRGESTMAVCRKCHGRMSFHIPEVKFLRISAAAIRASRAPPRKKQKERLGLTVGEELPKRGRCKHYSKSMRWFRFSCCSKVFPCDRCHDEVADHPTEHANRMICGFCSREQNYRPEDCGFCHAVLTGKKGSGFWEGGKGTRDQSKMSRKDPRKYKRLPGSRVGPSSGSKKK